MIPMFLWLGYTILLAILCYIAFDKYVRKWFKKHAVIRYAFIVIFLISTFILACRLSYLETYIAYHP